MNNTVNRIIKEEINKLKHSILNEMTAYHGSGSNFNKFSTKFMGTGEGSQVYGWGIYVSENKYTGNIYCEASFNTKQVTIYGKPIKEYDEKELESLGEGYKELKYFIDMTAEKTLSSAISLAKESFLEDMQYIKYYKDRIEYLDEEELQKLQSLETRVKNAEILLNSLKNKDFFYSLRKGNTFLYTVEIPDDNGQNYLQWDKEYSKQEIYRLLEKINDMFVKIRLHKKIEEQNSMTGERIYKTIYSEIHEDDNGRKTSELLSKCGYKGNKVPIALLDKNYQGEKGFNYVIFDGNDVKIKDVQKITL